MPELCQLDLQLAFETARTLRENIEYQAGSIEHAALEFPLEIALLTGRQRRSGNDQFRLVLFDAGTQFLDLALTDEKPRVGFFTRAFDFIDDNRAGRTREIDELLTFGVVRYAVGARVDENCTFAALRSFKQT